MNSKQQILDRFTTKCPDIELFTDASGELGFGINFKGDWMSERWPAQFKSYSIAWKELFPIYVACEIWAERFIGKKLLFHCDNKAVVDIWLKHTAKCPQIANLLCELFFTAAKHNFTVNASHIPGTSNVLADALFSFTGEEVLSTGPQEPIHCQQGFSQQSGVPKKGARIATQL